MALERAGQPSGQLAGRIYYCIEALCTADTRLIDPLID